MDKAVQSAIRGTNAAGQRTVMKQSMGVEGDVERVDKQSAENAFNWKWLTLFLFTAWAVFLCYLMLLPFLPALTGAVVLSIVTHRPQRWITKKLMHKSLAAGISVALVTLSIIGPAFFLAQSIGGHVLITARAIQSGAAVAEIQRYLNQSPHLSVMLQYSMDNISFTQAFDRSAGFIAAKLGAVLGGSFNALTQLAIMLFLLFYLYRDGDSGIGVLHSIVPLTKEETDQLFSRLVNTVRATVMGHILVSMIQGVAAGVTFALLGVPGASLLGVITAVFAMLPSFGAFFVWVPVAIFLTVTHHWIAAAILMIVGTLIISALDNILYPVFVGSQLRLHTAPIFLSILGGILVFGISGLVIGPVLFALAQGLLNIWRERLRHTA